MNADKIGREEALPWLKNDISEDDAINLLPTEEVKVDVKFYHDAYFSGHDDRS